MDNQEVVLNQIAKVFQNNLGNRITVELANGMIQEISKSLPQPGPQDVNNTTTDPGTKE